MTDKEAVNKSTSIESVDSGAKNVSPTEIIFVILYLTVLSIIILCGLIQLWDFPVEDAKAAVDAKSSPPEVKFLLWTVSRSSEIRLISIVILAGALGGLVHALRSLFMYVGARELKRSWLIMYFLRPFIGSTLGFIFYLVIRGGFFSTEATVDETSPFGFAALAGLVGLFSEQAVEKLKQVAQTFFAQVPKAPERLPEEKKEEEKEEIEGGQEGS